VNIDLIATEILVPAGLSLVAADNLFTHEMPADCRTGVLLRLPPEGVPIDWNIPGYHRADLQAIIRAQTFAAGDALAAGVSAALTFYRRRLSNQTLIQQMLPKNLPVIYQRSDGLGIEWSIDFATTWHLP
jgi:hypothetical protein